MYITKKIHYSQYLVSLGFILYHRFIKLSIIFIMKFKKLQTFLLHLQQFHLLMVVFVLFHRKRSPFSKGRRQDKFWAYTSFFIEPLISRYAPASPEICLFALKSLFLFGEAFLFVCPHYTLAFFERRRQEKSLRP